MTRGWLALRCDPDEKMIWEEAAKEKGMTMSAFVRSVLDKAALDIFIDVVERDHYNGKLRKVSQ